MFLVLALILFGVTDGYTFGITRNAYNGTVTFDGLVKACQTSFKNGKPCTRVQLYDGGWKQNIPISWILDLDVNCLGFTTDNNYTGGTAFSSKLGYTEMVTCNMYLAVCCYY
jgi:hypothetical protein